MKKTRSLPPRVRWIDPPSREQLLEVIKALVRRAGLEDDLDQKTARKRPGKRLLKPPSTNNTNSMSQPSDWQKSLIVEATELRGRIVTSYSQVEFLLADISVKLDLKFPYLIKKRIAAAKSIAERSGFEKYKNELIKICDDLLQFDELRNFMAHGYMELMTDKQGNHEFTFRMYQRENGETFKLVIIKTTVVYLGDAAERITEYVSQAVQLFRRIYLEMGIEES